MTPGTLSAMLRTLTSVPRVGTAVVDVRTGRQGVVAGDAGPDEWGCVALVEWHDSLIWDVVRVEQLALDPGRGEPADLGD